jgi:hypothetical protein
VQELKQGQINFSDGTVLEAANIIWAAGVEAHPIARTLGVELDRSGRILVEPDLSLTGHGCVFAIGDIPRVNDPSGAPIPGVSPAAMQMASHVARQIRRELRGGEAISAARRPFQYFDKGTMATIGSLSLVLPRLSRNAARNRPARRASPRLTMNRILVTGATGFIGYEVARQLIAADHRPRLMVRRPERGVLFSRWPADLMQADLESRSSLRRAVDGIDTVLHLGARATFEDYARLRPTIVDGSVALLEEARAAGVQRIVNASSLLVYESQAQPITASTPARSGLGYG